MLWAITVLAFDATYCEPPYPVYTAIKGADLIQVQVISRHGARTPLHLANRFSNVWTCKNTEMEVFGWNLSHSVHVHNQNGKSLFLGNCQYGQLVDKGVTAIRRLGQYLRRVYVNELKFLPAKFRCDVMKFRSTNSQRTIHSQMSLIRGMYADNATVTIETADKHYDPWRRASAVCPRLKDALGELSGGDEWDALGLGDVKTMEIPTELLGVEWKFTNDVLTSARCEGLTLPKGLTEAQIDEAVGLKAKQLQFVYAHDQVFPLFFSFGAAEMLNEMMKRMNGETRTRFVSWSGHDGNILSFLGFLGISDGKWPPYGSYIITELWRSKENGEFFCQFRYNGRLLKIPRFSFSDVIPFDDFLSFVNNHMPDMKQDCEFDVASFRKLDTSMSEAI